MVTYRWKYIGSTEYSRVFVDHRLKMTKVEGKRFIYYHKGIYPFHNPEYTRRFVR